MNKGTFHGHLKKTLSDLFLNTTHLSIDYILDEIKNHLRLYCDNITMGEPKEKNGLLCVPVVFDFGDLQSEFIFCLKETKTPPKEEVKVVEEMPSESVESGEPTNIPLWKKLFVRKPQTQPQRVVKVITHESDEKRWRIVSIE